MGPLLDLKAVLILTGLLQFKFNWIKLVERCRKEMIKFMLPKLDVKHAKDLTTLKIALQTMKVRLLKKHTTHNLDNHSNLQEDLGKLLWVTIKGTMETLISRKEANFG